MTHADSLISNITAFDLYNEIFEGATKTKLMIIYVILFFNDDTFKLE